MDEVRDGTLEQIDAMIAVKDAATAGWDAPPGPDDARDRARSQRDLFRHLMDTGATLVVVRDDRLIGFGTSIVREDVWFLSQLFVHPDVQSGGAGSRLLDGLLAMEQARRARVRAVLSSDDRRAFGLYLSRGMLPSWSMIQFRRRAPRRAEPVVPELGALSEQDIAAVDDLDRGVRGFARRVDHAFLGSIATAYALRDGGRLVAYAYVHEGGKVGPLVAATPASLVAMVDAVDSVAGPDASWSVPSAASVLVARLLDLGYRPDWQSTFCADGALGPFDRTSLAGGALL
jgi:GNAT superfamily N-acetyltransferase